MKYTECFCQNCGISFNKPNNEYNRKIKLNTPFYCSQSCSTSIANSKRDFSCFVNKNTNKGRRIKSNPFKFYIKVCKQRKYENTMTLEYLEKIWKIQNGVCVYTNIPLILNTHLKGGELKKDIRFLASLDRIDSSLGYIEGNVQFISTAINMMKNSMSHEDTIEFLQIIKSSI